MAALWVAGDSVCFYPDMFNRYNSQKSKYFSFRKNKFIKIFAGRKLCVSTALPLKKLKFNHLKVYFFC